MPTRRRSSAPSAPIPRWRGCCRSCSTRRSAHAARRTAGCGGTVGAGAEDGDDLSRRGAPRRPRRRQRALRGDPDEPLGRDVHRPRVRGRLRADRPCRPQDRAGDARNARRDTGAGRRAVGAHHAPSSRSCCRRASGGPTPPTTSSATRPGASATPTERCASASRTRRRLGLVDGGRARITTAAGSAEASVEISEAMLAGPRVAAERLRARLRRRRRRRRTSRASRRMRSRPRTGATHTPARRGTSTCRPASRP